MLFILSRNLSYALQESPVKEEKEKKKKKKKKKDKDQEEV